ncbi:hypothetical protein AAA799O18_00774, partial [Marine Group I thaumarchaeote SCGC AAA799-O18]
APTVELEITPTIIMDKLEFENLYIQTNKEKVQVNQSYSKNTENGLEVITYKLEDGYLATQDYYIGLKFFDADAQEYDATKVTKAVVGHFDFADKDSSGTDIKSQLILDEEDIWKEDEGYLGNFYGDGMDFTIFTANRAYKITVKIEATEAEPDSSFAGDFKIAGFNNITDLYIMPADVDTLSKDYQAIFINDTSVDITKLVPKFLASSGATVTANGTAQTSGTTVVDFSKGAVKYIVTDNSNTQEYFVNVVKKSADAKLFVNGPNVRELQLTKNEGHDIFIANVGAKSLLE